MNSVKDYYDKIGWKKRRVNMLILLPSHLIKGQNIGKQGYDRLREMIGESELLLDVACGAIPFDSNAKTNLYGF